jgi:hypothetical protein
MGAATRIVKSDGPLAPSGVTVFRLTGRWRPGQDPMYALQDTVRRLLREGARALVVDTSRFDASGSEGYVAELVSAFEIANACDANLTLVLNDDQREELERTRPEVDIPCHSSIDEAIGRLEKTQRS